jgi:hypothetical protein
MALTVSFVLSSGRRALLPPSPCGLLRRFTPVGVKHPHKAWRQLRAPGPHDFSVRARPRQFLDGWRALTIETCEDAVSAVSYRAGRCSRSTPLGIPAPQPALRADAVVATASRPASRDDRETPLVAGRGDLYIR